MYWGFPARIFGVSSCKFVQTCKLKVETALLRHILDICRRSLESHVEKAQPCRFERSQLLTIVSSVRLTSDSLMRVPSPAVRLRIPMTSKGYLYFHTSPKDKGRRGHHFFPTVGLVAAHPQPILRQRVSAAAVSDPARPTTRQQHTMGRRRRGRRVAGGVRSSASLLFDVVPLTALGQLCLLRVACTPSRTGR